MILYLSGPMSGLPDFNYPAFHAMASQLRTRGYVVINPAESGTPPGWEYADYLRHDLVQLVEHAEGVALLPGWRTSRGSRVEVMVAEALGLPVASLNQWMTHGSERS
ncbi:DUF4406 domain-containing protein [Sulfobacillus thermosulfidooxidans]|uniref:DUF4406 domain-containing protein n=1 Tax=Sulfobacillus thermosulfidooxidans TaxID=28034 RepID=UPI0006B43A55|nr:DUF4406 domain-containing protein [Sulfobacillus thermosulfidooxidans]